jgi:hypothetical protein
MQIDRYTKFVLTVIAVCLVWLSLGGPSLIPGTQAQTSGYDRVLIAGWLDRTGAEHHLPRPEPIEIARERGVGIPAQPLSLP